ncbi:hypothetical protein OG696_40660 [Streptomyces sp. NBC_00656]|uniref:hypothetical protein n=1 Tax=Streptomyces sp. NBC_00656 TaxID=2903668 RepID=UPI0032474C00
MSRADDLFAALHAIQLRAPRDVRVAAHRLFWRIVGRPFESGIGPGRQPYAARVRTDTARSPVPITADLV